MKVKNNVADTTVWGLAAIFSEGKHSGKTSDAFVAFLTRLKRIFVKLFEFILTLAAITTSEINYFQLFLTVCNERWKINFKLRSNKNQANKQTNRNAYTYYLLINNFSPVDFKQWWTFPNQLLFYWYIVEVKPKGRAFDLICFRTSIEAEREREKGGEGWRGEEKNRKYISQAVGEPKVGQPQLRFSVDAS